MVLAVMGSIGFAKIKGPVDGWEKGGLFTENGRGRWKSIRLYPDITETWFFWGAKLESTGSLENVEKEWKHAG